MPSRQCGATVPARLIKNREYQYADLASLLTATLMPLLDQGLMPIQVVDAERSLIVTRLTHVSGQWIESSYPIDLHQSPQQIGSALTYGRRYTLMALLCTAAEDDDGASATAAVTRSPSRTRKTPAPAAARTPAAIKPGQVYSGAAPCAGRPDNHASAAPPATPRLTDPQRRKLFATARDHGWNDDELRNEIERAFGCRSTHDLHRRC